MCFVFSPTGRKKFIFQCYTLPMHDLILFIIDVCLTTFAYERVDGLGFLTQVKFHDYVFKINNGTSGRYALWMCDC